MDAQSHGLSLHPLVAQSWLGNICSFICVLPLLSKYLSLISISTPPPLFVSMSPLSFLSQLLSPSHFILPSASNMSTEDVSLNNFRSLLPLSFLSSCAHAKAEAACGCTPPGVSDGERVPASLTSLCQSLPLGCQWQSEFICCAVTGLMIDVAPANSKPIRSLM